MFVSYFLLISLCKKNTTLIRKLRLKQFFQFISAELFIIFGFLFLLNNFIGNEDITINADGIGYYDYLPSALIRHDFNRKDLSLTADSSRYEHVKQEGVYVQYGDRMVDKYPIGTAVLQSPFFLYTHCFVSVNPNEPAGYQHPFQRSVFHATLFYLFLSLLFFKCFLRLYHVKKWSIVATQLLLVFATSVIHYTSKEAAFSHIYSLFAISAFLYFSKRFFTTLNWRSFFWMCAFLGLVVLIRQINILIIVALPFIAGSWNAFKNGIIQLFKHYKYLLLGFIIFSSIVFLQCVSWHYQTGHWLVYSYQGERFYFDDPHLFDILFSYKKGLFIYSPILFISLLLTGYWLFQKAFYSWFTFALFFGVLTYVLSSWWSWYYGCSYGLRAYVDFYTILLLPLAIFLSRIPFKYGFMVVALAIVTIPLNIIQTYQYKHFILHWIDMNKKSYWEVFLKTDEKYQGLIWKHQTNYKAYSNYGNWHLPTFRLKQGEHHVVFSQQLSGIELKEKLALIQWSYDAYIAEKNNSKFTLSLIATSNNQVFYAYTVPMIHFRNQLLDRYQRGYFDFEIPTIHDDQTYLLQLTIEANEALELKHTQLNFYSPRKF
jgi:hypothetical protein